MDYEFLKSPLFWTIVGTVILAVVLIWVWMAYRQEYHPVKPVPSPYKSQGKKSGFGPLQNSPERLLAEAMA